MKFINIGYGNMVAVDRIVTLVSPDSAPIKRLIQEFNRETNTIGSKAQDIEIARIVVDVKSEIEKIREQIQNIE